MVRHTTLCLVLFLLAGASVEAEAGDAYQRYLHRSLAVEAELTKHPEKLKFRHNSTKLIRLWELSLKKAKTQSEKRQALEGLVHAWKRLSHWSGTSRDRLQAAKMAKRLAAKPVRAQKPAPKKNIVSVVTSAPKVKASSKPATNNRKVNHLLPALGLEVVEDELHVLLKVEHELAVKRYHIPARSNRGHRVYFDVSPLVASVAALKASMIEHAAVKKLRVGQFDADTVRFVFDLERGQKLPGKLDFEGGKTPRFVLAQNRKPLLSAKMAQQRALEKLVEELKTADKKAGLVDTSANNKRGASSKKSSKTVAKRKTVAKKKSRHTKLPKVSTKGLNKTTIRAIAPRRTSELTQVRRIVIDPGHGGKDHGATCSKSRREKDVNLAIAKRLGRILKKEMGVKIIYTRTTDTFVSLKRRAEIANKAQADLFISVHANANSNAKVKGIETYYLNTTTDEYANRLARRENTSGPIQIPVKNIEPGVGAPEDDAQMPPGRIGRDLSLLLADLAMKSASEESRRLAGYIQSSVVSNLRDDYKNVRDLGVKRALFYVLLGVRMPSVLVESGFMSNPMEAKRLNDRKYQHRLANSIAQGIQRFVFERRQLAQKL